LEVEVNQCLKINLEKTVGGRPRWQIMDHGTLISTILEEHHRFV
jgi:hypothetical protein